MFYLPGYNIAWVRACYSLQLKLGDYARKNSRFLGAERVHIRETLTVAYWIGHSTRTLLVIFTGVIK